MTVQSKYILNTAPCQFSRSKTTNLLEYINMFYTEVINKLEKYGKHHIFLIFTNNSIQETIQMRYRTINYDFFNKLISKTFSSKSKKGEGYAKYNDLAYDLILKPDEDDDYDVKKHLPNLIAMCSHPQRCNDIITLLRIIKRKIINNTLPIKFDFTLVFDEADKKTNCSLWSKILKNKDFFNAESNDDLLVKEVHFITATPLNKFWGTLKSHEITILESIRHKFVNNTSFDKSGNEKNMALYRCLDDHEIIFLDDEEELKPKDYINMVLKRINDDGRLNKARIFAPGSRLKKSHESIADLAIDNGLDVLIINGDHKEFRLIGDEKIEKLSIDAFNDKYIIKGELRDTLRKYQELYPNNGLLITGNHCIERGITFNTDGFNFTDSIISPNICGDIESLIQFLGRSNGKKDYVDKHNVWIEKQHYDDYCKSIDLIYKHHTENPEIVEKTDFVILSPKEKKEKALTIPPIRMELTEDELLLIYKTKNGKTYDENFIYCIISDKELDYDPYKLEKNGFIQNGIFIQEEDRRNLNVLERSHSGTTEPKGTRIGINPENKYLDNFTIIIDPVKEALYLQIYEGSKIPK